MDAAPGRGDFQIARALDAALVFVLTRPAENGMGVRVDESRNDRAASRVQKRRGGRRAFASEEAFDHGLRRAAGDNPARTDGDGPVGDDAESCECLTAPRSSVINRRIIQRAELANVRHQQIDERSLR